MKRLLLCALILALAWTAVVLLTISEQKQHTEQQAALESITLTFDSALNDDLYYCVPVPDENPANRWFLYGPAGYVYRDSMFAAQREVCIKRAGDYTLDVVQGGIMDSNHPDYERIIRRVHIRAKAKGQSLEGNHINF